MPLDVTHGAVGPWPVGAIPPGTEMGHCVDVHWHGGYAGGELSQHEQRQVQLGPERVVAREELGIEIGVLRNFGLVDGDKMFPGSGVGLPSVTLGSLEYSEGRPTNSSRV